MIKVAVLVGSLRKDHFQKIANNLVELFPKIIRICRDWNLPFYNEDYDAEIMHLLNIILSVVK